MVISQLPLKQELAVLLRDELVGVENNGLVALVVDPLKEKNDVVDCWLDIDPPRPQ